MLWKNKAGLRRGSIWVRVLALLHLFRSWLDPKGIWVCDPNYAVVHPLSAVFLSMVAVIRGQPWSENFKWKTSEITPKVCMYRKNSNIQGFRHPMGGSRTASPSDKGGLLYIRIVIHCPVYAPVSNLRAGGVPHSSLDSGSSSIFRAPFYDGSKKSGVPRVKVIPRVVIPVGFRHQERATPLALQEKNQPFVHPQSRLYARAPSVSRATGLWRDRNRGPTAACRNQTAA